MNTNKILTAQMIEDTLALKGGMELSRLTEALGLHPRYDTNAVMALLVDLVDSNRVYYDFNYGAYIARKGLN